MIQRIQTLYLLIAAALLALLFAFPFAEIHDDAAVYLLSTSGITLNQVVKESGLLLAVSVVVLLFLHGYIIISFKNRKRQIQLTTIALLLMICLLVLIVYYSYLVFPGSNVSFKIGFIFPIIVFLLDFLALLGIKKDEALIRSIDRIR
jgi:CDP-diglyceride synthetase